MLTPQAGLLPLLFLALCFGQKALAFQCWPPEAVHLETLPGEAGPDTTSPLRRRSLGLADVIEKTRQDNDIVIVGRFSRNIEDPLFHETQLEHIHRMYSGTAKEGQMPVWIEYLYFRAFRFEGHRLDHTVLSPFSATNIHARVSISGDYGGIVSILPETGQDVIGILRAGPKGKSYEVDSGYCPSYYSIDPHELDDLMACYREGACR